MTVTETLARGSALLTSHHIENPGLDAALLLAETLGLSREKLIQRGRDPLPAAEARRFFRLIDRRISGECTAYILGRKEFRGLDFFVNPAVLVPRPDTETLVEAALRERERRKGGEEAKKTGDRGMVPHHPPPSSRSLPLTVHYSLLDLCTGSGAVAVALKYERPEITVFASDVSPEALETARRNAVRLLGTAPEPTGTALRHAGDASALSPAVAFIQSDLFAGIPRRFHLITANPPYVKTGELAGLSREVRGEPPLALDGGEDGLDLIRAIISRAPDHLFPGGALLLEADPRQMPLIVSLLEDQGFQDILSYRDLSGAERVIGGRIREQFSREQGEGDNGIGAFHI
jgi:release factor glutamine methyltransferase